MKINHIRIRNLFSYKDAEVFFEDYNVLVGHNASGKTNLFRILDFVRGPKRESFTGLSEELYLPTAYRNSANEPSSLTLGLVLSDSEAKVLMQVIFRTDIKEIPNEKMKEITLAAYWPKTVESRQRPEFIFLHFPNGFSVLKIISSDDILCFVEKIPDKLDGLRAIVEGYARIEREPGLVERFKAIHGTDHNSILTNDKFLTPFLNGDDVRQFFTIDGKLFSHYSGLIVIKFHDRNVQDYVVNIFEKCRIELSGGIEVGIWLVLKRFIEEDMIFQDSSRGDRDELADTLFRYRNYEGEQWKYEQVESQFEELFRSVKFSVVERKGEMRESERKRVVQITENGKTRDLQTSASGYFEALNIFAELVSGEDRILFMDEPALNLHPIKIRLLSKILTGMKKQVFINTHSPFFVVPSLFKDGSSVVYVKKDQNGISRFKGKPASFILPMRSYVFKPEVFFSACSIFVEGPGDSTALIAISDNLGDVFEHADVLVADVEGKGNIHKYVDLINKYELQHVAMVDNDYRQQSLAETSDFVVLPNKLEHELRSLGWTGNVNKSILPDDAYDVVDKAMKSNKAQVRATQLGRVFDMAVRRVGLNPDDLWK